MADAAHQRDEELPPDPERALAMRDRYRAARRAGLDQHDSQLFALADTSVEVLLLCVRKGATTEQIAAVCL